MTTPQAVPSPAIYSKERLQELAKPKKERDVWNFSRWLVSGNQDTIWPLSSRALMSHPTSRVLTLAKPKRKFGGNLQRRSLYVHSCGRESEIWERAPALYTVMPSERTLHLAEPRKFSATYLKQRTRRSPQWPVSMSALSHNASVRTSDLAQPRPLHPCFTLPKQAETVVSRAAMSAVLSPRIQHLAQPVLKKSSLCYDNRYFEAEIRHVSKAAQEAVASSRTTELARSKDLPPGSLPDRPAAWPVSRAAKHAVATPRLEELAQPAKRAPTNFVQFDPEAFTVKESAKKAICSERIKQLAEPAQR
ncbi:sperm microtubule associated protein 2-like isoform X1 [Tiliqua scincoides]|uniref:sperm microtubule associated protein 2-like isoform X1 n=1 Tax=Tiliqua scincoides TaxID=71010 RepID=UPI0034630652